MSKQPLKKVLQEYAHCFLGPDVISYLQVTFESSAENYVSLHSFISLNIYCVRIYAWARSCCSVLIEGQGT